MKLWLQGMQLTTNTRYVSLGTERFNATLERSISEKQSLTNQTLHIARD